MRLLEVAGGIRCDVLQLILMGYLVNIDLRGLLISTLEHVCD